jgi:hypothetical protein
MEQKSKSERDAELNRWWAKTLKGLVYSSFLDTCRWGIFLIMVFFIYLWSISLVSGWMFQQELLLHDISNTQLMSLAVVATTITVLVKLAHILCFQVLAFNKKKSE